MYIFKFTFTFLNIIIIYNSFLTFNLFLHCPNVSQLQNLQQLILAATQGQLIRAHFEQVQFGSSSSFGEYILSLFFGNKYPSTIS